MTSGFYRLGEGGALEYAQNGIATPTGTFVVADQAGYTYPIEGGWRHFVDKASALVFFSTPADGFAGLSRAQLRLGLLGAGITTASVVAVIDAIPDDTARETARIYWEDSTQFARDNPLIAQIGGALGLSDVQIDTMWTQAAAIA